MRKIPILYVIVKWLMSKGWFFRVNILYIHLNISFTSTSSQVYVARMRKKFFFSFPSDLEDMYSSNPYFLICMYSSDDSKCVVGCLFDSYVFIPIT